MSIRSEFRRLLPFSAAILGILVSCNKGDQPSGNSELPPDPASCVRILCEGNFNRGTGDIWYYDTLARKAYPRVFRTVNGYDLGNVVQSYHVRGNDGFIVVNNSGKIVVVDHQTLKEKAVLTGFQSPRYIIPTNQGSTAYVTDLYSRLVSIVDLQAHTKTGQLRIGAWTEQGVNAHGKTFVISRRAQFDDRPGGENLYAVDPLTNSPLDSISLGKGGEEVVKDQAGNFWISFDSIPGRGSNSALVCFDPVGRQVVHTVFLPGQKPSRLSLSPDGKVLFFIYRGISFLEIETTPVVRNALNRPLGNWNSLKAISGSNGAYRLIACDARDYNSSGTGFDIRFQGAIATPTDSFSLGIIPGNIY